jgi:DNA-directed RNA polymerase subunit RPC12/RpoP
MPEPKLIKAVAETICPHCSKKILISLRSYFPTVDWALKEEDLKTAKEKLRKGVEEITFDDPKRKEEVLSWLEQEEFMIGPEEVNPMLDQIIKDNVKPKKEEKNE